MWSRRTHQAGLGMLNFIGVVPRNLRELGYQRTGHGAAAGIFNPTKVTGNHVEQSQVGTSVWLPMTMNHEVE